MMLLLALLISTAMMLTGSAGELAGPVTRTFTAKNIIVDYGDESVAPDETITLAVQTDGQSAAYDFHIDNDKDGRLLPFQLFIDSEKLLLRADGADATYMLTAEALQPYADLLGAQDGSADAGAIQRYYAVSCEVLKLMDEPGQLDALRADADAIYDATVDRGEGTPEKVVFDGQTYDVTSYEYDLTAAQLGDVTEAVYASSDLLSRYGRAYFDMLASLPEEAALKGVDGWTALFEKLSMKMHIVESIGSDGFRVQDAKLSYLIPPRFAAPANFTVHAVRRGDHEEGTLSTSIGIQDSDLVLDIYSEFNRDGADMQMSATITGNPAASGEASGEQADEASAGADEGEDYEGEGDGEDQLYCAIDFSFTPKEMLTLNVSIDEAGGTHADVDIDRTVGADDSAVTQYSFTRRVNGQDLTLSFDVEESSAPFELRASADGAIDMENADFEALNTSVTADIGKLEADADWSRAMALLTTEDESADTADTADTADAGDSQPKGEMTFKSPAFAFVPEGYALTDSVVDEEFRTVSLIFSNAANGGYIYVTLNDSGDGQVERYLRQADGSFQPVEGMVVSREDYGDYVVYSADDGVVSYSIYPDRSDVSTEDVLNMFSGISFN